MMSFGWTISVVLWAIDSLAIYYGFVALNLDIGFIDSIQIFFTSLIYGIISFLPAGIGVTEGIFIGLLLERNIELPVATALILFIRFTTIWFLTFLGIIAIKFLINYRKS